MRYRARYKSELVDWSGHDRQERSAFLLLLLVGVLVVIAAVLHA